MPDLAGKGDGGGGKTDGGGKDGAPADLAPLIDLGPLPPDLTATCMDGMKNGSESDVDCGGMMCMKCADGKACLFPTDCESAMCNNNICQPMISCNDLIQNGDETDVDCGGITCMKCPDGRRCKAGADCVSGGCSLGLCCAGGKGNCDNNQGNGCEVTFATDTKNCGACGTVCPMNMPLCMAGMCRAPQMVVVGSYTLSQGPFWQNNPPTYTCQEACALLFGNVPAAYSCSTNGNNITHTANVDCWGDSSHCSGLNPLAENYKKANNYNCGQFGCSCSAFVSDNCNPARNYCWR